MMDKGDLIMQAKGAVIEAACGICSLPEEQLLHRMEELYWKGFTAGKETVDAILKDVSGELSQIVVAHLSGDQERLQAVLQDFVKRHVKVVVAPGAGEAAHTTH